jgi:hypothetical protein
MKKFAFIFILAGMVAFTATSCNDKEHSGGDNDVDSLSTMPAETPPPAQASPDTVAVPPVDPAMDTSMHQTPKM